MDDSKILDMYFARDERAIEETRTKYGRLLLSVALSILGNQSESEECESDTYLRTWESIPPNRPEFFSAYLTRIIRNLALNKRRGNRRRASAHMKLILGEISESAPLVSGDPVDDIVLREGLNSFIAGLDPLRRSIFLQRYFYMMSIKEISDECGFGEGTVKSILSRTRTGLRRHLAKRGIIV